MGLFGPTERSCPGGQPTTIIESSASGMPRDWVVRFDAGEAPVAGVVRESRSFLPFGLAMSTPTERPLTPQMHFHRRWVDASHRIVVEPRHDVVAVIE